tara:strand:- start:75 stop:434 length:360 start_codon:yes stop_codon:yes gene_type:complete
MTTNNELSVALGVIREFILYDLNNWITELFNEHPEYRDNTPAWLTKEYAWELSQVYGDLGDTEPVGSDPTLHEAAMTVSKLAPSIKIELEAFESSMIQEIERKLKQYIAQKEVANDNQQ